MVAKLKTSPSLRLILRVRIYIETFPCSSPPKTNIRHFLALRNNGLVVEMCSSFLFCWPLPGQIAAHNDEMRAKRLEASVLATERNYGV